MENEKSNYRDSKNTHFISKQNARLHISIALPKSDRSAHSRSRTRNFFLLTVCGVSCLFSYLLDSLDFWVNILNYKTFLEESSFE